MELINNEKALYTAFLCVGYGLLCGVAFTLLSLLFSKKLRRPTARAVADIACLGTAAVGLFLLSLPLTDGRPRFWLFCGTVAGFLVWKRWCASPFCRGCLFLGRPLVAAARTIARLWEIPRVKLQKNCQKTEIFFKNLLKSKRNLLYNKPK